MGSHFVDTFVCFCFAMHAWFLPRSGGCYLALSPGPSDSVQDGLPLTGYLSNWTRHWLATPKISAPPLF